jgi:hypothetical protein
VRLRQIFTLKHSNMNLILRKIHSKDWEAATQAALSWNKWHNKEGQQKHITIMSGMFQVHETKTGTIVVNYKL